MKSWVMMFLKTKKKVIPSIKPQTSCLLAFHSFFFFNKEVKIAGKNATMFHSKAWNLSVKRVSILFFADILLENCCHIYCSKLSLLVQAASLHLQTVAAGDRALPILTVTAEIWHKSGKDDSKKIMVPKGLTSQSCSKTLVQERAL